jgi:glutamine amidotransferase
MCIAILNSKGILPDNYIKNSWDNNNQGGGLLYTYAGKLKTFKTYEYKDFVKEYKRVRADKHTGKVVLHFRIATSGHERYTNLHPFLVNDNLGFVHNGIISGLGNKQYSDTYEYNEMLKRLPSDFLTDEGITDLISYSIGSSKLVFLDSNDHATIINEDYGHWHEGNWYSNDSYKYALDYVYYGNQKVKKNSKSSYADGNKWDYDWSYLSNTSTSCGLDTERDAKYYDDLYTDDNDYNTLWWYTNVTDANIRRLENFIGFGYKTEEFAEELGMLSYDFDTCDLDEILDQLGYINQP